MPVKKLRYELELDDDGAGATAQLLAVPFSTTRYEGELTNVRLLFATGQDHTLGSCSVQLFMRDDDHTSGQGYLLYDSGDLVDGAPPPSDPTGDPIDMNPATTDGLFWDDSLGEHRKPFEVNNERSLWIDIEGTPTAGAGTSVLVFEAEYKR